MSQGNAFLRRASIRGRVLRKAAPEFRGNRGVLAIFRLDDAEIRDAGGRSTGARSVRFAAARPDKSEGAELEKMTLTG